MTDAEIHRAIVDLWCASTSFLPVDSRWIIERFIALDRWAPLSEPERSRALGILARFSGRLKSLGILNE